MFLRSLLRLLLLTAIVFLTAGTSQASVIVDMESASGAALRVLPRGWKHLKAVDLYLVEDGVAEESDILLETLPDDPMVPEIEWAAGGDSSYDIGLPEAWDVTTGDPAITVAIIDTGIDPLHPDLQNNLWSNAGEIAGNGVDDDGDGLIDDVHGYNFWDQSSRIMDENGHGTHLAGVIGAVGNNGLGMAGINWEVRLMVLKFTDPEGGGSTVKAIEAIDYAIEHGAHVINASWTVKTDEETPQSILLLKKAIQKAGEAGVLFVAASGNQFRTNEGMNLDETPVYPASLNLKNMVRVAALDSWGGLAPYSNYGKESVDLAAPGSSIVSTLPDGSYGAMSGTSVATAFVSGSSALLLSQNPKLAPSTLKSKLLSTSAVRDALSGLVVTGGSLHTGHALAGLVSNPSVDSLPTMGAAEPAFDASSFPTGGCSLMPD